MSSAPGAVAVDSASSEGGTRLTAAHLGGFLIARRESILAAARDRSTVWIGLLFVIAAGIAREYDGEDLRREPWHPLIPLGASLVVAFVLHLLVHFRTLRISRRPFWIEFRRNLGLFWLTAPLALLYAIPYERMLTPAGAVGANLWTLALVASWRIALITRVISVRTGWTPGAAFWLVMGLAGPMALAISWTVPLPILQVMGGIRVTEAETTLRSIGLIVQLLSLVTFPIWLIGVISLLCNPKPALELPYPAAHHLRPGPMAIALASLLMWVPILPAAQREQRLRSDAEHLLRSGDLPRALMEMSRHERSSYPPGWDPPPRLGWPEAEIPQVLDVVQAMGSQSLAPWVREVYIDKLERRWLWQLVHWPEGTYARVRHALDSIPEGAALSQKHADLLARWERYERPDDAPSTQPTTGGAP